MIRIVLLLGCVPALCQVQPVETRHFTAGPVQFEADADGIVVLYHGHEWRPDASKLPIRADDCQDTTARKECSAHPGIACLACIGAWQPVAWDELNEILYLAASTGPKRNTMWIILGYDLRSEQINRVVDGNSGGYGENGVVSPSGRYLVLVASGICDACCPSSYLMIVDTQTRNLCSFHVPATSDDETVNFTNVRWTGSSVVEYSAEIHRDSNCRTGMGNALRKIKGTLDVPGLLKITK